MVKETEVIHAGDYVQNLISLQRSLVLVSNITNV